jgi:citrate lyase subunit beta/citryl-CoA lyase
MENPWKIRSWLLVHPSADPAEILGSAADRIVADLTGPPESWQALEDHHGFWAQAPTPLCVLLPSFSSGRTEAAVELAVRTGVDSVLLAGARSGADIQHLDVLLRVAEAKAGRSGSDTSIVALADAAGILAAKSFQRCSRRVSGLGWHVEGISSPSSDIVSLARGTVGLAAAAAGVMAVDAISDEADEAGLTSTCIAARNSGFHGKISRLTSEIPIINQIFSDQLPGRVISKTSDPPSA